MGLFDKFLIVIPFLPCLDPKLDPKRVGKESQLKICQKVPFGHLAGWLKAGSETLGSTKPINKFSYPKRTLEVGFLDIF